MRYERTAEEPGEYTCAWNPSDALRVEPDAQAAEVNISIEGGVASRGVILTRGAIFRLHEQLGAWLEAVEPENERVICPHDGVACGHPPCCDAGECRGQRPDTIENHPDELGA